MDAIHRLAEYLPFEIRLNSFIDNVLTSVVASASNVVVILREG